jgi:hypothetical protein
MQNAAVVSGPAPVGALSADESNLPSAASKTGRIIGDGAPVITIACRQWYVCRYPARHHILNHHFLPDSRVECYHPNVTIDVINTYILAACERFDVIRGDQCARTVQGGRILVNTMPHPNGGDQIKNQERV